MRVDKIIKSAPIDINLLLILLIIPIFALVLIELYRYLKKKSGFYEGMIALSFIFIILSLIASVEYDSIKDYYMEYASYYFMVLGSLLLFYSGIYYLFYKWKITGIFAIPIISVLIAKYIMNASVYPYPYVNRIFTSMLLIIYIIMVIINIFYGRTADRIIRTALYCGFSLYFLFTITAYMISYFYTEAYYERILLLFTSHTFLFLYIYSGVIISPFESADFLENIKEKKQEDNNTKKQIASKFSFFISRNDVPDRKFKQELMDPGKIYLVYEKDDTDSMDIINILNDDTKEIIFVGNNNKIAKKINSDIMMKLDDTDDYIGINTISGFSRYLMDIFHGKNKLTVKKETQRILYFHSPIRFMLRYDDEYLVKFFSYLKRICFENNTIIIMSGRHFTGRENGIMKETDTIALLPPEWKEIFYKKLKKYFDENIFSLVNKNFFKKIGDKLHMEDYMSSVIATADLIKNITENDGDMKQNLNAFLKDIRKVYYTELDISADKNKKTTVKQISIDRKNNRLLTGKIGYINGIIKDIIGEEGNVITNMLISKEEWENLEKNTFDKKTIKKLTDDIFDIISLFMDAGGERINKKLKKEINSRLKKL